MEKLLEMARNGEGRIVCTGDLKHYQISEAQAHNRFHATDDMFGWVLLPWSLTTDKDKERESVLSGPPENGQAVSDLAKSDQEFHQVDSTSDEIKEHFKRPRSERMAEMRKVACSK